MPLRHSMSNDCAGEIIDAGMRVHSLLGPGLLESAYEACLACELRRRNIEVKTQVPLPIFYEDIRVDVGYRIDLLVQETVIVELKTVARFQPIHEAQLLSYLKLSDRRVGLLMNFREVHLKDGIRRMVNNA